MEYEEPEEQGQPKRKAPSWYRRKVKLISARLDHKGSKGWKRGAEVR